MSYYLGEIKKKKGIKQDVKILGMKDKSGCPPCPACKPASPWTNIKTPLVLLGAGTIAYLLYTKFSSKKVS